MQAPLDAQGALSPEATSAASTLASARAAFEGLDIDDVAELFSLKTWRSLPSEDRERLARLLPPTASDASNSSRPAMPGELEQLLDVEIFSRQSRFFGAPLDRFWRHLQAGHYNAEALAAEGRDREDTDAAYTEHRRQQHNFLVHRLHLLKRTYKPPVPRLHQRNSSASGSSAARDQLLSKQGGGPVRQKKNGNASAPLGRPCLGESRGYGGAGEALDAGASGACGASPSADGTTTSKQSPTTLKWMIDPAASTGGMAAPGAYAANARMGAAHSQMPPPPQPPGALPGTGVPAFTGATAGAGEDGGDNDSPQDALSSQGDDAELGAPPAKRARSEADGAPHLDGTPQGAVPNPFFENAAGGHHGGSDEDGCPSALRFFELVRDAIASVPQAFAPAEYVQKQVAIQAQAANMVARLPRGTNLAQYTRSVLAFMATDAQGHAARTQYGEAKLSGPPPAALVQFDGTTQSYRWIGSAEQSSSAALRRSEVLHYELFLTQHGGVVGAGGARGLQAAPKAQKSTLTLPPGSAEQLTTFRAEERARYEAPEAAFSYTLRDGSISAVAPLGKNKVGGKARDHFLLVPERPPTATLLSLVRDAAARLPGGEGTRTDVCELLKESAFIMDGVNDSQISTVASGALDRLHYETDPPVRYDGERKLWIYLHGQRNPGDWSPADIAEV